MTDSPVGHLEKVLQFIRDHPRSSIEKIADELGLEYHEMGVIFQELQRQNVITGDRAQVMLSSDEDIQGILQKLHIYEPRRRGIPTVMEEVIRRIDSFQRNASQYLSRLRAITITSYKDVIDQYSERINEWIDDLRSGPPSAREDLVTLENDLHFTKKVIVKIVPSMEMTEHDVDDRSLGGIASYNDLRSLTVKSTATRLFPITVSLSIAQKAAILKSSSGTSTTLYEPETPGAIDTEHLEDMSAYPAYLNFNDKVRIRYSKNKVYLYNFAEKIMREYAPAALLLAESVLPPDMYPRDFEKPFRREKHLDCMNKSVNLANTTKIFDCPVAQVTRSSSVRRRETSILMRLLFGLVADSPQEYIDLTTRGNYDDIIFSYVSRDQEISPCFVVNEALAYLKDQTSIRKAQSVFGDDDESKKLFNAYQNMLGLLQTAIVFVNYRSTGLRLRFLSQPLTDTEIGQWSARLSWFTYMNATKEGPVGCVNCVEQSLEAAKNKGEEIFGTIMSTLEERVGGGS